MVSPRLDRMVSERPAGLAALATAQVMPAAPLTRLRTMSMRRNTASLFSHVVAMVDFVPSLWLRFCYLLLFCFVFQVGCHK